MASGEHEVYLMFKGSLLLTHLEFGARHRHQLALLTNGELIGPGPVGDGLCPGEVVPILNHLCYHFVVCLGAEKSCGSRV